MSTIVDPTTYDRFAAPVDRVAQLEAMDPAALVFVPCGKCAGAGYLHGFEHVENGVCFQCGGARGDKRTVRSELKAAKAQVRREARREAAEAKRQAEADARRAEWVAANPEVHAILQAYQGPPERFLGRMVETFFLKGALSEAQAAAVLKAAQTAAERERLDAEAEPAPTGRVVITGEVIKRDVRETQFGLSYKLLVRDDRGFRVWGTLPRALDGRRGDRVTFTATIEPSTDDPKFGFYSRPSKASTLEHADQEEGER